MADRIYKDLTQLSAADQKLIIDVICENLRECEDSVQGYFRKNFTTKSFYEMFAYVVDCYLFESFPNHKQAMKVIKEAHNKTEKALISSRRSS